MIILKKSIFLIGLFIPNLFLVGSHETTDRGFIQDIIHANPLLIPLKNELKKSLYASVNNPFNHSIAYVRAQEGAIAPEELQWRKRRLMYVKKAQEKFLGMKLADNEVLDIGLSLSGGGFRAMLGSIGSMLILEKTGLLDCIMSMAGLSGSTWFIGPWLTSGMTVANYKEYVLGHLLLGIVPDELQDLAPLVDRLSLKFAYEQPLSTVDLYGTLLANRLFDWNQSQCQNACLYGTVHDSMLSQYEIVAKASHPLPIYTMTLAEKNIDNQIFECTPFEIGCREFDAYVPSWAFGRKFKEGTSVDFAPEQSLGFVMGIAGSAFGVKFKEIYDFVIKQHIKIAEVREICKAILQTDIGDERFAYAEINNFMYNLKNCALNKQRVIKMVDAGTIIMNPMFATYRRPPFGGAPDILIACDYGQGGLGLVELGKSAEVAKKNGQAFPDISDTESGSRVMTVFDEHDLEIPVLIYMPRIKDQKLINEFSRNYAYAYYTNLLKNLDWENIVSSGYANTFNFFYTKKQAETVCALSEFNMLTQIENIRQVMIDRVLAKRTARN